MEHGLRPGRRPVADCRRPRPAVPPRRSGGFRAQACRLPGPSGPLRAVHVDRSAAQRAASAADSARSAVATRAETASRPAIRRRGRAGRPSSRLPESSTAMGRPGRRPAGAPSSKETALDRSRERNRGASIRDPPYSATRPAASAGGVRRGGDALLGELNASPWPIASLEMLRSKVYRGSLRQARWESQTTRWGVLRLEHRDSGRKTGRGRASTPAPPSLPLDAPAGDVARVTFSLPWKYLSLFSRDIAIFTRGLPVDVVCPLPVEGCGPRCRARGWPRRSRVLELVAIGMLGLRQLGPISGTFVHHGEDPVDYRAEPSVKETPIASSARRRPAGAGGRGAALAAPPPDDGRGGAAGRREAGRLARGGGRVLVTSRARTWRATRSIATCPSPSWTESAARLGRQPQCVAAAFRRAGESSSSARSSPWCCLWCGVARGRLAGGGRRLPRRLAFPAGATRPCVSEALGPSSSPTTVSSRPRGSCRRIASSPAELRGAAGERVR